MIDSKQLVLFVTLAEDMHFGRAADRLDIAQSVLSEQIKKLEQDLGARLLNRNKRAAMSLTDAGQVFLIEARAALDQLRRADQVGRAAARGESGKVILGYVGSTVTSGYLPLILKTYRRERPAVTMQILAMETPRQLQALIDGTVDVGFLRPRPEYPEGVIAEVIHSEGMLIAMANDHALTVHDRIEPAQLRGETFIAPQFNEAAGFSEHLTRLGRIAGFDAEPGLRVNDFVSAVSMAAAGYGIVLVPKSLRQFVRDGVTYREVAGFDDQVKLAMAYRSREQSACVRGFIGLALSACTESPSSHDY